jgi:hypothetical protein
MVVKSKKKVVPLTFQQRLDHEVQVFKEQAAARAKLAMRAYDAQDKETQFAIDTMVERIVAISRGIAAFKIKGRRVAAEVPTETIRDNAFYLATEILKDLALLDIRIANFRFDPQRCAECQKLLRPAKKRKVDHDD